MSMGAMLAASQSLSRMQTMQSVRNQMQGNANVLRIESKQDGGNAQKDAKAEALDQKSNRLMGQLMGEMSDVNEVIKPEEEAKEEGKEAENTSEKNVDKSKKMDTITLSDIAAGYRGPMPEIIHVADEPVTYEPNGSKAVSTFEATA